MVATPELEFLEAIPIDERHTLDQLLGRYQTVKDGLPELIKNAKDQYARRGLTRRDERVVVVLADTERRRLGVLDFAGAGRRDFDLWLTWSDPRASRIEAASDIEGRHGNGGKGFMVRGSTTTAYLEACHRGRRTKMGFRNDSPAHQYYPAYFVEEGRAVNDELEPDVSRRLEWSLERFGLNLDDLPEPAREAFERRGSYTIAVVDGVRDWVGRRVEVVRQLSREIPAALVQHPQAALSIETCAVYVVADRRQLRKRPLSRDYPDPLPGFERPRRLGVPDSLDDPETGEPVTTSAGERSDKFLSLRTSMRSLRMPGRRPLNVIRVSNERNVVASWSVADLYPHAGSAFIYGELQVPALELDHMAGGDRRALVDTPLVRALYEWVSSRIEVLCGELQQAMAEDYDVRDRRRVNRELREFRKVMSDYLEGLSRRRQNIPKAPGELPGEAVTDPEDEAVALEGKTADIGTAEAVEAQEAEPVDDAVDQVAGMEETAETRRPHASGGAGRGRRRTIVSIELEPQLEGIALAAGTTIPLVTRVIEEDRDGNRSRARAPRLEMALEPSPVVRFDPDGTLVTGLEPGRAQIALRDPKTGVLSEAVEVEVVACRGAEIRDVPERVLKQGESVDLQVRFETDRGWRDDLVIEASLDEIEMGRITREATFTAGRHAGTVVVRVRYGPRPRQTVTAEIEIGREHLPDRELRRAEGGRIPHILICGTPAPGMEHYPPEQRTILGGSHEPTIIDFEPEFEHVIWINPSSEESVHVREGRGGTRGVAGIGTKSYLRFLAIKCFEILKRLYVRQHVRDRMISEVEFRRLFAQAEVDCAPFVDDAYDIAESLARG